MGNFVLITETNSDLPLQYCADNDIELMYMSFSIDDVIMSPRDMSPPQFYAELRKGKLPVTAQTSVDEWLRFYEPFLQAGRDVLSISFSSGLSGTCNSAHVAAKELLEKYPQRKLVVVDSLCASLGLGLLVHSANQMRQSGASLDEVARWTTENRLRVCHGVAVNDLMHLHRGGRLSATAAVAGSLLGVKPILRVDNHGKLESADKVRGRKASLQKLVEIAAEHAKGVENPICMISHSDCEDDAQYVATLACERIGARKSLINFISPAVGSHTGIGTVALFVMGDQR